MPLTQRRISSPLPLYYQPGRLDDIRDRMIEEQRAMQSRPMGIGPLGLPWSTAQRQYADAQQRAAQLYMQQHFPQYSGNVIGKNVYAPRYYGRGRSPSYGGGYPSGSQGYTPRVVATGEVPAAPAASMATGTIISEPPPFSGPKTVEEIQQSQMQNREAIGAEGANVAIPTGRMSYGTVKRPQQGYMWIGGPEGEADYDLWLKAMERENAFTKTQG